MAVPATALVCAQLRVRELRRSVAFYRRLGLRVVAQGTMENGEQLAWIQDPFTRQTVELYFVPRGSRLYVPWPKERTLHTPLLFAARDLDASLRWLSRRGSRVVVDFTERGARVAFVTDPDGHLVELVGWADRSGRAGREPPLISLVRPRTRGPRSARRRRSRSRTKPRGSPRSAARPARTRRSVR